MNTNRIAEITKELEAKKMAQDLFAQEKAIAEMLEAEKKAAALAIHKAAVIKSNEELTESFWNVFHKVRGSAGIIATIADQVTRYAMLSSSVQSILNITSMLPTAVIGPIGTLFQIFTFAAKDNEFLATKIVNLLTNASASSLNIVSIAVQNIAAPLAIAGAALSFVKYAWALGDLYYRQSQGEQISTAKKANAIHDTILSGLGVAAAIMLFFPLTAPAGFIILAGMGVYRALDAFGLNPIKKLSCFKEETATEANETSTTADLTAKMTNELVETEKATQAPVVAAEVAVQATNAVKAATPEDSFKPIVYRDPRFGLYKAKPEPIAEAFAAPQDRPTMVIVNA